VQRLEPPPSSYARCPPCMSPLPPPFYIVVKEPLYRRMPLYSPCTLHCVHAPLLSMHSPLCACPSTLHALSTVCMPLYSPCTLHCVHAPLGCVRAFGCVHASLPRVHCTPHSSSARWRGGAEGSYAQRRTGGHFGKSSHTHLCVHIHTLKPVHAHVACHTYTSAHTHMHAHTQLCCMLAMRVWIFAQSAVLPLTNPSRFGSRACGCHSDVENELRTEDCIRAFLSWTLFLFCCLLFHSVGILPYSRRKFLICTDISRRFLIMTSYGCRFCALSFSIPEYVHFANTVRTVFCRPGRTLDVSTNVPECLRWRWR